jgi:sulfite reductase (NADPH) hemoprotein beta-component
MLKVISANDLADGTVVYFKSEGAWTKEITQAKTFTSDDEIAAGLALAKADEKRDLIVDPFAVDVLSKDGHLEAVSLRNAIRANGPTIKFLPANS